jgi:hypothetical protein
LRPCGRLGIGPHRPELRHTPDGSSIGSGYALERALPRRLLQPGIDSSPNTVLTSVAIGLYMATFRPLFIHTNQSHRSCWRSWFTGAESAAGERHRHFIPFSYHGHMGRTHGPTCRIAGELLTSSISEVLQRLL